MRIATGSAPRTATARRSDRGRAISRGFSPSTAARAAALSVNQVASIGGVVGPFGRQRLLGEDRVDRAFRLAGAAVDALVRIDEQLAIRALVEMDAIDRTDGDARHVEHVDARLGDHIGHSGSSSRLTTRSRARGAGLRAYHPSSAAVPERQPARRDDPADGDLHPARPVTGDVTADGPRRRAGRGVGRDRPRPGRRAGPTPRRSGSPATSGGTLTTGVGPGGALAVAASATSHASWTDASPMTASWTSRPPLMTWRRTVSPGDEVERVGQERVVLGDDVDLARRSGRAWRDRSCCSRGGGAAGHEHGERHTRERAAQRERRAPGCDATARSLGPTPRPTGVAGAASNCGGYAQRRPMSGPTT